VPYLLFIFSEYLWYLREIPLLEEKFPLQLNTGLYILEFQILEQELYHKNLWFYNIYTEWL
jgi:hypothetical protein